MSADLWTQRGGDGGHTAYVDVAVNPAGVEDAWNQPLNYSSSGFWAQNGNRAVAIDETHVYRTDLEGYWATGNYHVIAYDLQSGAEVWNTIIVGDGGTATGVNPTHAYADNGIYTVTLTVSDGTLISTDTMTVTVNNVAPSAGVTGPATGVRGQSRTFTFTADDPSAIDQAAGFSFTVNWGDGSNQTVSGSSGLQLSHVFTASGSYGVTVTATDKDSGVSVSASHTIAVVAAEMQGNTLVVGGTTAGDQIIVTAVHQSSNVNLSINGVGLGTFNPTGDIIVCAQAGNDNVELRSVRFSGTTTRIGVRAILFGGEGNDVLNADGSAAANVLVGGAGADQLLGGRGRDLLFGGLGADILRGGDEDDMLFGGVTTYDENLTALAALRNEWARTDVDYTTRVNHLTGASGGGMNGSFVLNASTALDDGAVDELFGESGRDWLLARTSGAFADLVRDKKSNETLTGI